MKNEWRKIGWLLKRELFEFRSPRLLVTLAVFGGLQGLIMMGGRVHGRMEDTLLIFLIGGACTVVTGFDLVAREREQHTLDLLLIQGISRPSLFIVKWLTALILSLTGAAVFCLATGLGTLLGGFSVRWVDLLAEFLMITWTLEAYALIALSCSVLFRRSRTALIGAVMAWVILRPAVIGMLLIDPLQRAFHLDKNGIWQMVAFIPEFAFRLGLDPARGMPEGVSIPPAWPYLALAGYTVLFSMVAWLIFRRQDEPV